MTGLKRNEITCAKDVLMLMLVPDGRVLSLYRGSQVIPAKAIHALVLLLLYTKLASECYGFSKLTVALPEFHLCSTLLFFETLLVGTLLYLSFHLKQQIPRRAKSVLSGDKIV